MSVCVNSYNCLLNMLSLQFFLFFQESLIELHKKFDVLQGDVNNVKEMLAKGPANAKPREKVLGVDAQDELTKEFQLPLTSLNQVSVSIFFIVITWSSESELIIFLIISPFFLYPLFVHFSSITMRL